MNPVLKSVRSVGATLVTPLGVTVATVKASGPNREALSEAIDIARELQFCTQMVAPVRAVIAEYHADGEIMGAEHEKGKNAMMYLAALIDLLDGPA